MLSKYSYIEQTIMGYLPTTLIKIILEKKDIGSESFPIHSSLKTVALYADISHFIQFSANISNTERLSPEILQFCLNHYLEQLISIINTNGGDIIKFAGDAIIVIWPPDSNDLRNIPTFLSKSAKRAIQCAFDIQKKLKGQEIANGQSFKTKIGIGIGECKILIVGGVLDRFEYVCVGEAINQAFEGEKLASNGGDIIVSLEIFNYAKYFCTRIYEFKKGKNTFYQICSEKQEVLRKKRIQSRANASLIRRELNKNHIIKYSQKLMNFIPLGIQLYLSIQSEKWAKEVRMVSIMFIKLNIDLSQLNDDVPTTYNLLQKIIEKIQRCSYKTRGSLNKFLVDDKGSVVLLVWGLQPISSFNDSVNCVFTGILIWKELESIKCKCDIGITTGICFSGVCGTMGNRREYSLISEKVNLASICMEMASEMQNKPMKYNIVMDETTKNVIEKKIKCQFWKRLIPKGYNNEMNFYIPNVSQIKEKSKEIPFPLIRTHFFNYEYINSIGKGHNFHNDEKKRKDLLQSSMLMIGNVNKLEKFTELISFNNKNSKKNILIQIDGYFGCGKSLFIRKGLSSYLTNNQKFSLVYMNAAIPNVILCSYQIPFRYNSPFNGINTIMHEIYKVLEANKEKYSNDFDYDVIGEMILKANCENYLNFIQYIIQCENEHTDLNISIHFSNQIYSKFQKDTEITIEAIEKISELFYLMILKYISIIHLKCKQLFPFSFPNNISFPLIIVIEDSHEIDSYTTKFISHILNKEEGNNIVIITSYQIPLYKIISPTLSLFFTKEISQNVNNIHIKQMTNPKKLYHLFKSIMPLTREENVEKISNQIISFIQRMSIGGIPLFAIALFLSLYDTNAIYLDNNTKTIIASDSLKEMILLNDYKDLNIPFVMEKYLGEIIDQIPIGQVILLKLCSVIGNLFDSKKMKELIRDEHSFILSNKNIYPILKELEEKQIIEFIYDDFGSMQHKNLVCQFNIPFLREVLYQRMLLEQKTQCHSTLAKIMNNNFGLNYLSDEIKLKMLEMHLRLSEKSLNLEMENHKRFQEDHNKISTSNLKTFILKKTTNQLTSKNSNIIKSGYLHKKSDGKLTWELRYFVLTENIMSYYYNDYIFKEDVTVPLGSFYLYNIFDISTEIGIGKKTVFSLFVKEWNKKNQSMPERVYYLDAKTKENVYEWTIALSLLKMKAVYEKYCNDYGFVFFPFYDIKKGQFNHKRKRKHSFYLAPDKMNLKDKRESISFYQFPSSKKNIINSNELQEKKITYIETVYNMQILKLIFRYSMGIFIGNIQSGIENANLNEGYNNISQTDYKEFDLVNVPHLENQISKAGREISLICNSIKEKMPNLDEEDYFVQGIDSLERYDEEIKSLEMRKKSLYPNSEFGRNKTWDFSSETFFYDEEVGSFNDKGEEKIDHEDYLKYPEYINDEYEIKDLKSLGEVEAQEGGRKKNLFETLIMHKEKRDNQSQRENEVESQKESEKRSTKTNINEKKTLKKDDYPSEEQSSKDSIEKKTFKLNHLFKCSTIGSLINTIQKIDDNEEVIKFTMEPEKENNKISKKRILQLDKESFKSSNESDKDSNEVEKNESLNFNHKKFNDSHNKRLDFAGLVRLSITNNNIRKSIENKTLIELEKDKVQNACRLKKQEPKRSIKKIPSISNIIFTCGNQKGEGKREEESESKEQEEKQTESKGKEETKFKMSEEKSEKSQEEGESQEESKSNVLLTLPKETNDINSNNSFKKRIEENIREKLSLQSGCNLVDKLKALDVSIENEQQYYIIEQNSKNETFYTNTHNEQESSNTIPPIGFNSSKYKYLSKDIHTKKHISNFFQRNKNKKN